MKYGQISGHAKRVSRLILGTVPHCQFSELSEGFELNEAFKRAGGNAFDVAHMYGNGKAHAALGAYFQAYNNRNDWTVFDKGACFVGRQRRTNREAFFADLIDNLARLGEPRAEFFTFHRDDQLIPISELVDWGNEAIERGLIQHFGGSNFSFQRLKTGNDYAAQHGKAGFSLSSPNLSLAIPNGSVYEDANPVSRIELLMYEESQMPLLSWAASGSGYFVRNELKWTQGALDNPINEERRKRVEEFAKKRSTSPNAIALAWVLNLPINGYCLIGPMTIAQLNENLESVEIDFDPDEMDYLEFWK